MSQNIPDWLPELEKWEHVEYDGIKGFPPEWVPQPHKKRFHTARSALFFTVKENKASYSEIRSRFDDLVANKNHRIVLAIMRDHKDYDEYLFFLVDLFKAVLLGSEKGLGLLAGPDAVRGRKVLDGVLYAHEQAHGTKQEKENRWAQYYADCVEVKHQHPHWRLTAVRQEVADKHGVNLKTIERHTPTLRAIFNKIFRQ